MWSEMAVADIGLETSRGRRETPLDVTVVGELSFEDLGLLTEFRGIKPNAITALRDRHHALAQCLANGMSDAEASLTTGYCISRISILKSDPTFKQLVSEYRGVKEAIFADFNERASAAAIEAINLVHDRLENNPDSIPTEQALKVIETLADRSGHAPVAKSLNVNANVDFGNRLALARQRISAQRAGAPESPVIEGEVLAVLEAAE